MNRTIALLGLGGWLAALPALAADGMQPGQYEYTMKMEMPGMSMAMPPMTAQHCLTQADIDQGRQYENRQSPGCQTKNFQQSPGKAGMEFTCQDGTTGKGEYSFGSDSLSGKTTMTRNGQTFVMTMAARRTGDCRK